MPTLFTQPLLSPLSVRLGRLVLNRRTPHESFHDPPDSPGPTTTPQKNLETRLNHAFTSSTNTLTLHTRLAKLLGAAYHRTSASRAVSWGGGGEIHGAATDGETAGVEAGVGGEQVQKRGWRAEGEQVYAVQYRKAKLRTFSGEAGRGVLGENRWRVYLGRGTRDEEDSVEAVLDDREGGHEGEGEGEGEEEGEVWLGDDEEFLVVVK